MPKEQTLQCSTKEQNKGYAKVSEKQILCPYNDP